ncbi:BAG domain-containing protein Samui-like isoform X2 [Phymastichus coffea]|uniref:BAG domain-containing protein Samui-like isoform X2 n=1 Tax=Phymastichus coffea TaxID=108790 RepID=UPI00273CA12B|nr:BAG domain-containing protein Samui-like isoform X2 [Phymastichus coffea]XP_058796439.1 BAG domain-containing protein Samui-like isoform X2 [Phymastichus coffea]XP_058796440.1 BAG domain-containing protein Samui-like isoform X2 [Phymastichus coffea]XP_058809580.1 BAG domain-containing protein Samui-like isoform X2 [Phymastichus coffea]XP_058809581.1 BAG domain-containing protein Samui-like isoform X2 [Phymastichus coffea]XP_058809582.1 BAG domain-containing protein Samui-like isoform X2 [Ph
MDSSPVIIDNASKFGRDLDPRAHFPGFPFDDEGIFGHRADIRSRLDDLAARHPEFADHLLGSAWDEVPFSAGSLRRGNRRPSQERPSTNNVFHSHPDEDARSQASGGSAASGASGVSSHGSEADQASVADTDSRPSARKIPQYSLRNTVDIGQHQHNMEAPQQQRNVRSMSAPPENRQNEPRFVSRVEINPQQEVQQQQQPQKIQQEPQREKSPPPQAQQQEHKTTRPQSNVRQIPIFVEGRDKPVIAKDVDEPDFTRRQSPPQFTRPSQHYQSFNRQPAGWTSHFHEPFFEPPQNRWTNSPPSHPQFRHSQQQQQEKPRYTYQTETQPRARQQFQPQQQQQQKPQHPQNEPQQEQAPPKPKQQVQPKDPLEKVAAVQQEVNALAEQVKEYSGNSRTDKQYMYLDEMLTRELIKLDDIDTEGKENVRTARKQAIKSIQETISLLESKASLSGPQTPQRDEKQSTESVKQEEQIVEQSSETKTETVAVKPEAMETQETPTQEEQKAIPLPPPLSSTKNSSSTEPTRSSTETTAAAVAEAASTPVQPEQAVQESPIKNEPMDASPAPQEQQLLQEQPMEVRQSSPAKELQLGKENQQQSQAMITEEQKQEVKEATASPEQPTTEKPKKEPPPVPAKPNRSPKKSKKSVKQQSEQQPISDTAIPLPAPGQSI